MLIGTLKMELNEKTIYHALECYLNEHGGVA